MARRRPVAASPRHVALALLWLGGSGSIAGCGAKTGLDVPDANRPRTDAAVSRADAGVREPPPICVEVTPGDPSARVELAIPASLRVVDVLFLLDASASMQDEIDNVRGRLRDVVVPGVRAIIPDAAFGVALFGEFPVLPHARPGDDVGPFRLRTPVTQAVEDVESALDDPPVWGNLDDPEASIEGLYQVATGEGLAPWIERSVGCASGGAFGACFRPDAFRVVLLATDAPMHNGPPGVAPDAPYAFTPAPHTYAQTLDAVRAAELFVIGLGASDAARPEPFAHLRALGRDTGSVDGSGAPLIFDIGSRGDRIGEEIVGAVRRLAEDVPLDVEASVEDRLGDPLDALEVIRGIRALSAEPPEGVASMEGARFAGVRPGTRLLFELSIDASELDPSDEARIYRARVIFRASGRSRIEARDLDVVVPADDGGGGCEEGGDR